MAIRCSQGRALVALLVTLLQRRNDCNWAANRPISVLIGIANAPLEVRAGVPRGVRLFTAGAPPAAATIELVERELGWELTHVYGLTPLEERAKTKARQGVRRAPPIQ